MQWFSLPKPQNVSSTEPWILFLVCWVYFPSVRRLYLTSFIVVDDLASRRLYLLMSREVPGVCASLLAILQFIKDSERLYLLMTREVPGVCTSILALLQFGSEGLLHLLSFNQ